MKVLIACEFSGVVRDAFLDEGHNAISCDLQPTESESATRRGLHWEGDVRQILGEGWDLMIAHPPCTYLSRAGARWWKDDGRAAHSKAALEFVFTLRDAPIPRICIENPIGQLNRLWRYPDQTIEPWHFGHPYSKRTCLWLKNLPPLMSTAMCGSYTPLLPSNTGWNRRKGGKSHPGFTNSAREASRTFPGIAKAMASQWGILEPMKASA